MAYGTATLTGTYKTFDNQPASGVVEIIPNSRSLVDAEGDVILAGRVKVALDGTGSFTVTLPATDDTTVEPATGRQYTVVAKLRHTHLPAVTGVELATGATVDVADVASVPVVDPLVSTAASLAQLEALEATVDAHAARVDNPHATTAVQVGADPAGSAAAAQAAAIAASAPLAHVTDTTNPHAVTKTQVGLGNVDNVSASALRDRSTHTGTQPVASITGLADVATTGAYGDLTGTPTIPTTPEAVGAEPAGLSAATDAALSATYAPLPTSWDAVTGGAIIPHRGGALQVPEHTMDGYRVANGQGFPFVEMDIHRLADGSFGVMHDSTVNRATTAAGNVNTFTAAAWKQLTVKGAALVGGNWADNLKAPLFEEVLTEFGNSVLYAIEVKTVGVMGEVVAALTRRGIAKGNVLLHSFTESDCEAAVALGWQVAFLGSTNVANAAAKGFAWIVPEKANVTQSLVDTAHAAGVKVGTYTVNRRYEADPLVAMGMDAIYSDDPVYLDGTRANRTTDLFDVPTWLPGQQANSTGRGQFFPNGAWGYLQADPGGWSLHGYLRPPDPTNFVMDFTIQLSSWSATDRWMSVALQETDYPYTNQEPNANLNGYTFLIRVNSQLDIYRSAPGAAAASLASNGAAAADFVADTDYQMRLTVTPTQLTLARVDGLASVTVANSAARPAFINFGRNGAGYKVKDISIT